MKKEKERRHELKDELISTVRNKKLIRETKTQS